MAAKKKLKEGVAKSTIIALYMEYVLDSGDVPKSVYKFCKEVAIAENDFYRFFGSFASLQKDIWNTFFEVTINLLGKEKSYESYGHSEKMLTFFYTFFEMLTVNRGYVLFAMERYDGRGSVQNLRQLKGLRRRVKDFSSDLIQEGNDQKVFKLTRNPTDVFSEGAWLQFLFLLKFWINDNSAGFEKTDVAIEKSVRAIFAVFDNSALDNILDFGKFIWKESMNN